MILPDAELLLEIVNFYIKNSNDDAKIKSATILRDSMVALSSRFSELKSSFAQLNDNVRFE